MNFFVLFFLTLVGTASAGRNITLDAELDEWILIERMRPKPWEDSNKITYQPDMEIYGTFDSDSFAYCFAFKTDDETSIEHGTTIWLDTDQNAATGFFGKEFQVEIDIIDGKPYLYNQNWEYVTGPLEHMFGAGRDILEVCLSSSDIGNLQNDIDFVVDVNNNFSPTFTIKVRDLPPRPGNISNKRVAVVFSQTSADNFFDEYVYSQLYTSMQHQAMMAGIPFDLISVGQLKILDNVINYDALIFPYNANINNNDFNLITTNLEAMIYHYGISIITSDNWLTAKETGESFAGNAYQTMQQLLGVTRVGGFESVDYTVAASNTTHPVMDGYLLDEPLFQRTINGYYSYFEAAVDTSARVTVLAEVDNGSNRNNAILASETYGGARHVHFGIFDFMGNSNLVWQAIRWAVFGDKHSVGLQLSRKKSVFIGRCDMDMARFINAFETVTRALYENFILLWKEHYNFVGAYFINIGDDEVNGEYHNWTKSRPLYQKYIDAGNEIGSHSYTHPHFITDLSESELIYEFDLAQQIIKMELNLTRIGTAQPGNPENFDVVSFLERYLFYFSGTWNGVGSGYPSTFGFLKPDSEMFYFAPNMKSDFTLIEWQEMTAEEATTAWANEYQSILNHASTPIVNWHFHDYGPTMTGGGYNAAMFSDTIEMAYSDDAEFVTMMDLYDRIKSVSASELFVSEADGVLSVTVLSVDSGRLALDVNCQKDSQVIEKIDGWYAYNDKKVFLPTRGGTFGITCGESADDTITHIAELPMRAELLSVDGDGIEIEFKFIGEGDVILKLNASAADQLVASGMDAEERISPTTLKLVFDTKGAHTATVAMKTKKKKEIKHVRSSGSP